MTAFHPLQSSGANEMLPAGGSRHERTRTTVQPVHIAAGLYPGGGVERPDADIARSPAGHTRRHCGGPYRLADPYAWRLHDAERPDVLGDPLGIFGIHPGWLRYDDPRY